MVESREAELKWLPRGSWDVNIGMFRFTVGPKLVFFKSMSLPLSAHMLRLIRTVNLDEYEAVLAREILVLELSKSRIDRSDKGIFAVQILIIHVYPMVDYPLITV